MHAREVTRRHAGLPGTSREHHSTHDTPQDTRHTPRGQHAMAGVSFLGRKVYFRVGEPEGRRVSVMDVALALIYIRYSEHCAWR